MSERDDPVLKTGKSRRKKGKGKKATAEDQTEQSSEVLGHESHPPPSDPTPPGTHSESLSLSRVQDPAEGIQIISQQFSGLAISTTSPSISRGQTSAEGIPTISQQLSDLTTSATDDSVFKTGKSRRKKGKGKKVAAEDQAEQAPEVPGDEGHLLSSDPTSPSIHSDVPTTWGLHDVPQLSSPALLTKEVARQRKRDRPIHVQVTGSKAVSRTIHIPSRPDDGGKIGQPVQLTVNCYNLRIVPKLAHVYHLEAKSVHVLDTNGNKKELKMPPKDKRSLLLNVIDKLPPNTIYDGGHTVYTVSEIPGVTTADSIKEMTIKDPLNSGKLLLCYRICKVQLVSTGDLQEYLSNPYASSINMPQDSIRVLDCVFKTALKGSFETVGRASLFYKNPAQILPDSLLSIHRGFLLSCRPQWQIRFNVDMTCKAFLTAGNMADVLHTKYGDRMHLCVEQMERDIKRIRVETAPIYKEKTGQVRRFTAFGLSRKPASHLIISDLNQTVADYFANKHGIVIQYPELPCVNVSNSREVFFPMELLHIRPFQSPNSSKAEVAAAVIRLAAIQPRDRFREIQQFVNTVTRNKHPVLTTYGIETIPTPVQLTGRVLPTPTANFGRENVQLRRGCWEAPSYYLSTPGRQVTRCAVISVPPHQFGDRARRTIISDLPKEAQRHGLTFRLEDRGPVQSAQLTNRIEEFVKQKFDLVILVLHDEVNYSTVKQCSDLLFGIRTQCVRDRTLNKPRVMPNLLLKINGKLAGINWIVPSLYDFSKGERFMVVGADVTHPAPTQSKEVRMSIAAVTASITPDLMRYATVVRQQETTGKNDRTTREIVDSLSTVMEQLIKCYARQQSGDLPTKLMFYRDGVSEGQFETVLLEEMAAIQRACTNIRPGYQPGITYIVVQKRHHLRFNPIAPAPRNRTGNVEPGTVIDTEVVHHREFDFYLSSSEGIQGTSKPAHYHVLYDDANWSSDALQCFTFYLCHAYMRCTRSVSYPAPTYYAHLAAFRAREWLSGANDKAELLANNGFRIHDLQVTGMFFL